MLIQYICQQQSKYGQMISKTSSAVRTFVDYALRDI